MPAKIQADSRVPQIGPPTRPPNEVASGVSKLVGSAGCGRGGVIGSLGTRGKSRARQLGSARLGPSRRRARRRQVIAAGLPLGGGANRVIFANVRDIRLIGAIGRTL